MKKHTEKKRDRMTVKAIPQILPNKSCVIIILMSEKIEFKVKY